MSIEFYKVSNLNISEEQNGIIQFYMAALLIQAFGPIRLLPK